MILIISMRNIEYYREHDGATGLKIRLERLAGMPSVAAHYSEASAAYVKKVNPLAIIITGSPDPWVSYRVGDLYALNDLLHETEIPVLGICQGHQLIGHCFNLDVRAARFLPDEPMRKRRKNEPDTGGARGRTGYYYSDAFTAVRILRPDPIFRGLKGEVWVRENHFCEIKKLPRGFIRLAESADCRCEMMRLGDRALYGAQFHAERWETPYMDGRAILRNFFRIALGKRRSGRGGAE